MPNRRLALAGQRFGRLRVGRDIGVDAKGSRLWRCTCDCGTVADIAAGELQKRRSCGCAHVIKTHGAARKDSPFASEYAAWEGMKARCYNPNSPRYKDWGGRGIRVCKQWRSTFANFLADMGPRPPGTSLHRIANNKGYTPTNCKWATTKEQTSNRRPKKLRPRQVAAIRRALADGQRQVDIAKRFKITQTLVSAIKRGKVHAPNAAKPVLWRCP